MLLLASARDALVQLRERIEMMMESEILERVTEVIGDLEEVLFLDVEEAHTFVKQQRQIHDGQRLSFSRLVPSYCDRQMYFELIIGGMQVDGVELSDVTKHSIQYDTKLFFDKKFQQMIEGLDAAEAIKAIATRASSALAVQLMMVNLQSTVNLAQVYQWFQEKSLLSMGALLFNPSPGINMQASDLTRNLFMSPWTSESLVNQERQHALQWLEPIEVPCHGDPKQIDQLLVALIDGFEVAPSETEHRLIEAANSPMFAKQDLTGLLLYARVLTLWEHQEDSLRESVPDATQRQRQVATELMRRMASLKATQE